MAFSLCLYPSLPLLLSHLYTSFLYVRQWLNYGYNLCGIASFKNKNSIFWNIVTSMSWAIWTKWIETICWSLYILLSLLKREDHIYKEFWSSSIQVSETFERDNICSYVSLIAICYILSFIRFMVVNEDKIMLLFFLCHAFIFKYFRKLYDTQLQSECVSRK